METFLELYKGFKPYIPAGIIAYIYQVFIAFAVRLQVCALSMMSFDVNHNVIIPERRKPRETRLWRRVNPSYVCHGDEQTYRRHVDVIAVIMYSSYYYYMQ